MRLYIWQRYFLRELGKSFAVTLLAFYALYVIIDSASQLGAWRQHQIHMHWQQWSLYYLCELLYRADVLLPFALLLATLRTLLTLQANGELIALLCSGVSMQAIVRPFLGCAILLGGILYLNAEYGVPLAVRELKVWQNIKKKRPSHSKGVQEIALSDGSRLLYHDYEEDSGRFNDLFWVQSGDAIIRMRHLFSTEQPPRGTFIEELRRSQTGELVVTAIEAERHFPALIHEEGSWRTAALNPEQEPLFALWQQLPADSRTYTYREAHLVTAFYQRLILPWLCLLAIAIAIPYCVLGGRRPPTLVIYACTLFGLVAFYLLLDAVAVLGRRQIIDPPWALLPPLAVALSCACYNYCRLR